MELGTQLINNFHLPSLGEIGSAIDCIRINSISMESRDGRSVVLKRRRKKGDPIAMVANVFFRMAHSPISVWVDPAEWQRWETGCFRLVNGDRFRAVPEGSRTICLDRLPGRNLRELLAQGRLTRHILEVSAAELRRAHQLQCRRLGGGWSHGDMEMSNIIYDKATDRSRLIDFEVIHDKALPVAVRHADDLLVFLQDMVGRVSARQWVPFAICFIKAYDRPKVIAELKKNLVVPFGAAGLWWKIRAGCFDRRKLARRIAALNKALVLAGLAS